MSPGRLDKQRMRNHSPKAPVVPVVDHGVLDSRVPADGSTFAQFGVCLLPVGGGAGPKCSRGQVGRIIWTC